MTTQYFLILDFIAWNKTNNDDMNRLTTFLSLCLVVLAATAQMVIKEMPLKSICSIDTLVNKDARTLILGIEPPLIHSIKQVYNSSENDNVVFRKVTMTKAGELANLLGDDIETIDSLVVCGPINTSDFNTMWSATFHHNLKVINLENSEIENNRLPNNAFWHPESQIESGGQYVDCIMLRKIILPDNVESIGAAAFSYAINLEEINIPIKVKAIGEYAFSDCISLKVTPLILPEGFETLERYTFLNCTSLSGEVILPSSIRSIGVGAFFQAKISDINFPEGLEQIAEAAFYGCKLKKVILPNSCQNLDEDGGQFQFNFELEELRMPEGIEIVPNTFAYSCKKLKIVNIPSSIKEICWGAFRQCTSLSEIHLPEGLERIEFYGLWYLNELESITFPSTLKSIGGESCSYWTGIKEIKCAAIEPPICENSEINPGNCPFGTYGSTFYARTPQDTPIYVPVGSAEKYRKAWGWNYFTNIIESDEFSSVEEITDSESDSKNDLLYDLFGRKISIPIKGQIYIKNGKKILIQ